MYDKYNRATTFRTGTGSLPAHKGILFNIDLSKTGGTGSASCVVFNGNGTTGPMNLSFAGDTPTILPISVLSITGLTGVTAWLLN